MRVARCTAAQRLALTLVGLPQPQARPLRQSRDLRACDFKQPAVGGVCNRLLLHRRVDDHALELGRLDRLHAHRSLDRGLEQLLDAGLTEHAAESADLRVIARQLRLVVLHAAEELPHHVLAPARHQRLVALVEGVLQVQQRDHQANRQPRAAAPAHAGAHQFDRGAEQVGVLDHLARAVLVRQQWRECSFDLIPGHACGQHRQRVAHVDHRVQPGAEKVGRVHRASSRNSQELRAIELKTPSSRHQGSPRNLSVHAACR